MNPKPPWHVRRALAESQLAISRTDLEAGMGGFGSGV